MTYRSQLTTSPYPYVERMRQYYGSHGTVTLTYTDVYRVEVWKTGERQIYETGSKEVAAIYYARKVREVM